MNAKAFILALAALGAFPARAVEPGLVVGFAPHAGGGRASIGGNVRHTTGYTLGVERVYAVGPVHVGPRVELGNTFVNHRARGVDGGTQLADYDNRVAGVGGTVLYDVGGESATVQHLHLSVTGGRAWTKLAIDESGERFFRSHELAEIHGTWATVELGAFFPLRHRFGLTASLMASRLDLDQSRAAGRYREDRLDDGGALSLTAGNVPAGARELAPRARFETVAGKIGFSVGI